VNQHFLPRFIKGIAATSSGVFFEIALGFFSLMVAVRYIPKEQFGIFVLLQVISFFFMIIGGLPLDGIAVTRLIASSEDKKKIEITNTALTYRFLTALIMTLLILPCKPLILLIVKYEQLSQLFIYVPLLFLFSTFYDFLQKILQGFHKYGKMAVVQVMNGSLKILLIILFLIVFRMGVLGLIYAFLLSFAIAILFQYFAIPVKKKFNFNPAVFSEIFKFGFPLGLNNILTFIYKKVDRFMLGAMMNPTGVAYYEIASKIPENSRRMYQSFQSVFFPHMSELFSKNENTDAEKVLNNSLRFVAFLTLFGALVATLFQKEIIRILFSDRYLESAHAFSLLMIATSIGLIGNVLGTSLVSAGYSRPPLLVNIFSTVTNVLGNLIMIPIWGVLGAVYATILTSAISNPILVWFFKKNGIRISIKEYIKPFLLFVFCWILFLRFDLEGILVRLLLICFFLASCWVLNIITKRDFIRLTSVRTR